MRSTVHRYRLTNRLRTPSTFPPPTPHHHITTGLLPVVPFTWYIMSGYQDTVARHTKGQNVQTQFEERVQASEPYMAGTLELLDWEFKTTMIHMLRDLMDKADSIREQRGIVHREMKILRRNARDFKKTKTNKQTKTLQWVPGWLSWLSICFRLRS